MRGFFVTHGCLGTVSTKAKEHTFSLFLFGNMLEIAIFLC